MPYLHLLLILCRNMEDSVRLGLRRWRKVDLSFAFPSSTLCGRILHRRLALIGSEQINSVVL